MDPFVLLVWLLVWIIYLAIQSVFINGIYISSYGTTGKKIDGSDDDSEMIFYPIYKFLHKTYTQRLYFIREMLDITTAPRIDGLVIVWEESSAIEGDRRKSWFRVVGNGSTYELEKWIKNFYQGKMVFDQVNRKVAFYIDENRYVFSKYLRKPILGCIICMSSFWSIFTYALPVYHFYGWSWHITLLWFIDIVSLSYVNFIIFKKRV